MKSFLFSVTYVAVLAALAVVFGPYGTMDSPADPILVGNAIKTGVEWGICTLLVGCLGFCDKEDPFRGFTTMTFIALALALFGALRNSHGLI